MPWTVPASWSVSEVVTAAKMNTHIRDNLNYLKGAAGTVAIDSAMTIATTGGSGLTVSGSATTTSVNITMANVASQNAQLLLTNTGQRTASLFLDRATGNGTIRLANNNG